MIHLDTNLLIGAEDPSDTHHQTTRQVLARPDSFACSAVAWMEFLSYPGVPQPVQVALKSLLTGGIIPFDEKTATLAGEIFHLTGSKRRTRLDCMIAATAILAGAALATTNPADFQVFTPHGLNLHPL